MTSPSHEMTSVEVRGALQLIRRSMRWRIAITIINGFLAGFFAAARGSDASWIAAAAIVVSLGAWVAADLFEWRALRVLRRAALLAGLRGAVVAERAALAVLALAVAAGLAGIVKLVGLEVALPPAAIAGVSGALTLALLVRRAAFLGAIGKLVARSLIRSDLVSAARTDQVLWTVWYAGALAPVIALAAGLEMGTVLVVLALLTATAGLVALAEGMLVIDDVTDALFERFG